MGWLWREELLEKLFYPGEKVETVVKIFDKLFKLLHNLRARVKEKAGNSWWLVAIFLFICFHLLYAQVYEVVGRDVDEDIFPDVWRQGTKPVDPQALFVCLKPSFSEQTHKIWISLPWATSSCCWAGSHCCRTRRQESHHPRGLNLKWYIYCWSGFERVSKFVVVFAFINLYTYYIYDFKMIIISILYTVGFWWFQFNSSFG